MNYHAILVALLVGFSIGGAIGIRNDIRKLKARAEKEAPQVARMMGMPVPKVDTKPKPLVVPVGELVRSKKSKRHRGERKRSA